MIKKWYKDQKIKTLLWVTAKRYHAGSVLVFSGAANALHRFNTKKSLSGHWQDCKWPGDVTCVIASGTVWAWVPSRSVTGGELIYLPSCSYLDDHSVFSTSSPFCPSSLIKKVFAGKYGFRWISR